MTEMLTLRPEVAEFVAAVRSCLADLTEDEREELVGGLEADLAELVDDRGVDALGDPASYAAELRAAAGLAAAGPVRKRRTVRGAFDATAARFGRVVEHPRVKPVWDVVVSLRPVWWVLRAWIAIELVDIVWGRGPYTVLPGIADGVSLGLPLLLAAIVASVLLGRLTVHRPVLRLGVLAVNVVAVVAVPTVLGHVDFTASDAESRSSFTNGYVRGYDDGTRYRDYVPDASDGLAFNGRPVINVFPYDAQGKPLQGIQLFNENGEPLVLNKDMATVEHETITYPWLRDGASVWNVFPMPVGPWLSDPNKGFRDDNAWFGQQPPAVPASPVADVRPVSLPQGAR